MNIILNGKKKFIVDKLSLAELVKNVCQETDHVIVELNGKIIKRQQWHKLLLSDGDVLEFVTIVGGG